MKLVIQKINSCKLYVDNNLMSEVKNGLLVLVGVDKTDTEVCSEYLAKKISSMRLFKDENDKINKSILDVCGDIMVVSNFTLNAEISSGTRPSFSNSADYDKANSLYLLLADEFKKNGIKNVATGCFRNHMHLNTELDGPFTIVIEKNNN